LISFQTIQLGFWFKLIQLDVSEIYYSICGRDQTSTESKYWFDVEFRWLDSMHESPLLRLFNQ